MHSSLSLYLLINKTITEYTNTDQHYTVNSLWKSNKTGQFGYNIMANSERARGRKGDKEVNLSDIGKYKILSTPITAHLVKGMQFTYLRLSCH